jgi:hypothetical protein
MIKNWIDWHLKKGAVGAVGEKSPQENPSYKEMKPSAALGRRNGGSPVGYSVRIALRKEQCDA